MSNLLKDASILLTPTGYDNGSMNAIKPSVVLGLELITNGNFLTNLDGWILSPSTPPIWDNGMMKMTSDGATFSRADQSFVTKIGAEYKFKINKLVNNNSVLVKIGNSISGSNVLNQTLSSINEYTFTITAISTTTYIRLEDGSGTDGGYVSNISVKEDLNGDFTFSRNSAATRVNAQGLVENVQILSSNLVSNGDFSQEGVQEVSNGSFSQEGAELVTNGSFTNGSTDWNLRNAWVVSNGICSLNPPNSDYLSQSNVLTSNKSYKLTFDIIVNSGNLQPQFFDGGWQTIGTYSTTQTVEVYFKSTSSGALYFKPNSFTGSIDNVSVKEVGQDWTLGTGWSIGENKVISVNGGNFVTYQPALTSGKTYKISYEVKDYVSGSFSVRANAITGALVSANGIYTDYLTSNGIQLYLMGGGTFNGSITNISVKEVGQDWTLGTGWSIGGNQLVRAVAVSGSYAQTSYDLGVIGRLYKISINVAEVLSGTLYVYGGLGGTPALNITSAGVYTVNHIWASDQPLGVFCNNSFTGSIDNISVIEITDDTNLPRINYEGFSYQDSLGSEKIVNGDFATDSNWSKGTGWSIANGTASHTGGASYLSQSVLQVDTQYKVNISVTSVSGGGFVQIYMGNSPASVLISTIGDYTYYFTSQSSVLLGFALRSLGDVSIDNVSVKEYLGQEVVPNSGCGSWLLEPQSTNLISYSEDFSNSYWTYKSEISILSNNGISPNGTLNADKIIPSTSNTTHYIGTVSQPITGHNYSVFVKSDGYDWILLTSHVTSAVGTRGTYFNINNGTIGTIGSAGQNPKIENYGNGWYRCSIDEGDAPSSLFGVFVVNQDNATNFQGDGVSGVYLWGAEREAGSYPTSYIPTTQGATSTRLQDIATNSGNASLINSEEGVLYVEASKLVNGVQSQQLTISDGTNDNLVIIQWNFTANRFQLFVRSGGGTYDLLVVNNIPQTDMNKIALSWDSVNYYAWINGVKLGTKVFTSQPVGLNNVSFDQNGASNFYGKTKALAVYKTALTDANLRSLTYPPAVATTFDLDFDTIAEQFTFTRGSEATFVNAQGLIQSTNEIGSEEITNGDFATDSDWSKGTGWSISGGLLNASSVSSNCFQSSSFVLGKTYKLTYSISNYVSGSFRATIGSSGFGQNRSSNGTFVEYIVYSGANFFYLRGSSSFIGSIDNVSVKEYITATNTPRLDYSTGAEAFLLEPQSTNLITQSENLSNMQIAYGGAISLDSSFINPSGQNGSYFIYDTDGGAQARFRVSNSGFALGDKLSYSVFIKSDSSSSITIGGNYGGENCTFNVGTKTLISQGSSVDSYEIINFTNGWTRYVVNTTFTNTVPGNAYPFFITNATLSEKIYVWGHQLEQKSYATSYIPTSGASATRNQELCNNATPVINSEEGTLYAEIATLANDGARQISISSGSNNERLSISYNTNGRLDVNVRSGGVYQVTFNYTGVVNPNIQNKIALKYKLNDFALWVNGVEVATDSSGITPIGLNVLNFSSASFTSENFFGNTKDLKYYPKALADVQLQDLTTI
jgi:hypothetical protein